MLQKQRVLVRYTSLTRESELWKKIFAVCMNCVELVMKETKDRKKL